MRLLNALLSLALIGSTATAFAADFDPLLPREGGVGYFKVTPISTAPQRFCVGVGSSDPARCAKGDGPGVFIMTADELLQFRCTGAKKISEEIVTDSYNQGISPVIIRFTLPQQGCAYNR